MLKKEFPEEYDFFPTTYNLPYEMLELKNVMKPLKEDINELSKPKVHAKFGKYPKNYDPKGHAK